VYVLRCDGGSWAGNKTKPVVAKPSSSAPARTVYCRGWLLLDALDDHLLGTGLWNASEMVFAGCSTGGLPVNMHSDYIAARRPERIKPVALADAMFNIDTPNAQGSTLAPEQIGWIFDRPEYVQWLSRFFTTIVTFCARSLATPKPLRKKYNGAWDSCRQPVGR
jgi:hypothetical protein